MANQVGSFYGEFLRGARWNDVTSGTWSSVDPVTRLADPNRANAYSYSGGDPINFTDPDGQFDFPKFSDFIGGLSACVATGGEGLAVGTALGGPEGAAVGFVYGCGAGVIANGSLGFNPLQNFNSTGAQ